ncbi:uncharacterized protein PAC_04604 [Phialocephala subalpina]|uniref:RNase H type-1 domain-containing protein n=1 Tax=Phialocephala subalpina TaxID=576137 RepID=A0A1L7WPL9_9HELO|nr:uncharacterized protein PAC_04604 [Phialocephala subalpina]
MSSRAAFLKHRADLVQDISNLQSSMMEQDTHQPSADRSNSTSPAMEQDTHQPSQDISNSKSHNVEQDTNLQSFQDFSDPRPETMEQNTHQPAQNIYNSIYDAMEHDTMMSESSTTSTAAQPRTRRRPGFLTKEERQRLSRTGRQVYLDRLFSADFPGKVTIDPDADTALSIAYSEYSSGETTTEDGRMVFWTDVCRSGDKSGIGIVYRKTLNGYVDLSYHIRRPVNTWVAEMAAIAQAIKIAEDEIVMRDARPSTVVIYSDCQKALLRYHDGELETVPCRCSLLRSGIVAAHNLKPLGIEVELRWVPGHWNTECQRHIKENLLAHSAAKKAARLTPPEGTENLVDVTNRRRKRAPVAMFKTGRDSEAQSEIENGLKNLSVG